jgi:hypothetical protein
MSTLERDATAMEIVWQLALVVAHMLLVVSDRVVGILLMPWIRLLRRRVHANTDHLFARMVHNNL